VRKAVTRTLCLALCGFALSTAATADDPVKVNVTVDTSEVPELEPWAMEAKALVEEWHPKLCNLLNSEGFTPPADVSLVFKKDYNGVAATSGRRITIAADWVKKHPEDKGMVIHELCHVIQAYGRGPKEGWLVEGIADYVRFFKYEPQTRVTIRNPEKASYRDSYRTAAKFLDWAQRSYDPDLVATLNAALRTGKYRRTLFEEMTKKDLDELWKEFIEQEARGKGGRR
jgi:hypothetical protein